VSYLKLLKLIALTELIAICVSFFAAVIIIFDLTNDTPVVNMVILIHAGLWTVALLLFLTFLILDVIDDY
jgi:hypothetical protein